MLEKLEITVSYFGKLYSHGVNFSDRRWDIGSIFAFFSHFDNNPDISAM
jgi:hypothetical protein